MPTLHHVQVSCPPDGEPGAREFYAGVLGLAEVAKPAELAGRGGAWFRAYDEAGHVTAELHVGVEQDFRPARKAHPAFVVDEPIESLAARLENAGFPVDLSQRHTFPGYERLHTADAAGNRVELLNAKVTM